jgi:hypothetical protein
MTRRTTTAFLTLCVFMASGMLTPIRGQGKGSTSSAQNSSSNDKLAKKLEWEPFDVRLFHDIDAKLVFNLATSWIPGEDRKGRFRYKIEVRAGFDKDTVATLDSTEKLFNKAKTCDFFLKLLDADEFELRDIPLTFDNNVNSSLMLVGLSANSSVPMTAVEYRSLVGAPNSSGKWSINWRCRDTDAK